MLISIFLLALSVCFLFTAIWLWVLIDVVSPRLLRWFWKRDTRGTELEGTEPPTTFGEYVSRSAAHAIEEN